ncbi:MAG: hypothetical protein OEW39_00030 [Deltaproteobacteria bacterium]|nr:hypothetical protein [Deltaproteobacteria bacterium]
MTFRQITFTFLILIALLSQLKPARGQTQDILIYRPADRMEQSVTAPGYRFKAEISAFAPLEAVRIDGKAVAHPRETYAVVEASLVLKPGRNRIVVEAKAGGQTVQQEFLITLKVPSTAAAVIEGEPAEPEAGFHLVSMAGAQRNSNPARVPPERQPQVGWRGYYVLVPRYDWAVAKGSTLRLQGIAAREAYYAKKDHGLEVEFTQAMAQWIQGAPENGEWQAGLGVNIVDQRYRTLMQGRFRVEQDAFLGAGYRRAGAGAALWGVGLELKRQDMAQDPGDPERVADATVVTLNAQTEDDLMGGHGKARLQVVKNNALGKYQRFTAVQLALEQAYTFDSFIPIFSVRMRDQSAAATDPLLGVAPRSRILGASLLLNYALGKSWLVMAELATEKRVGNLPDLQYTNTALGLSLVNLF